MNIFCIEQNYFTHKRETPDKVVDEPVIFVKPQNALLPPGAAFFYPPLANELYCGCELVLRISKSGKNIEEKDAGDYYDAITTGLNFIALFESRELSEESLTWEKAKAWKNSSVEGHWFPVANFNNKKDINFCLYKNRALVQLGNSGLMVHNFNAIISFISRSFSINDGDLIFTGTPAGIGKALPGDKLEAFVEDDSVLEFDID